MEEGYAGCEVSIYNVAKPSEVIDCNISLTEKAATTLTQMAQNENHQDWHLLSRILVLALMVLLSLQVEGSQVNQVLD